MICFIVIYPLFSGNLIQILTVAMQSLNWQFAVTPENYVAHIAKQMFAMLHFVLEAEFTVM